MKAKKIVAVLLALMITVITGCNNDSKNPQDSGGEDNTAKASFSLLYCSNDTFNPYTLKTKVNMELCQLLYDPLVSLDNTFSPVYKLAESAVQNANVWTITLKNAVFSDNSPVKSEDVVYSFNFAKESPIYASAFSHVLEVTAEGNKVIFTLSSNDPFFVNLLNFPIIKTGSDDIRNEDSVLLPPIGAGRYVLNSDENGLEKNTNYYLSAPKYDNILLVDAPDSESVAHYVEVGATDLYYASAGNNDIFRMDGKKFSINQNRLVYLGVNLSNPTLNNIKVRYGISAAINREKIASTAYYNNAVATNGPFSPFFKETVGYQTIETSANNKIAIENLEQIGYNILDNTGIRMNENGNSLSFSLLINNDNPSHILAANLIKSQLFEAGIKITVNALSYSSYVSALQSGSFQLYLAEVKINNNFDFSPLITAGGSCAYGVTKENADASLTDIISKYKSGEASVSDVITAIGSQMPFIPICYRSGMIFYSKKLGTVNNASADDLFMFTQN